MSICTNHIKGGNSQRGESPKIPEAFKLPRKVKKPSVSAILTKAKQLFQKLQQRDQEHTPTENKQRNHINKNNSNNNNNPPPKKNTNNRHSRSCSPSNTRTQTQRPPIRNIHKNRYKHKKSYSNSSSYN